MNQHFFCSISSHTPCLWGLVLKKEVWMTTVECWARVSSKFWTNPHPLNVKSTWEKDAATRQLMHPAWANLPPYHTSWWANPGEDTSSTETKGNCIKGKNERCSQLCGQKQEEKDFCKLVLANLLNIEKAAQFGHTFLLLSLFCTESKTGNHNDICMKVKMTVIRRNGQLERCLPAQCICSYSTSGGLRF